MGLSCCFKLVEVTSLPEKMTTPWKLRSRKRTDYARLNAVGIDGLGDDDSLEDGQIRDSPVQEISDEEGVADNVSSKMSTFNEEKYDKTESEDLQSLLDYNNDITNGAASEQLLSDVLDGQEDQEEGDIASDEVWQ